MLIDLHRLLIFLQLDSTLLNSRLDLLMKDFALIHTVRVGIVQYFLFFNSSADGILWF
jgi:hypothetical protein